MKKLMAMVALFVLTCTASAALGQEESTANDSGTPQNLQGMPNPPAADSTATKAPPAPESVVSAPSVQSTPAPTSPELQRLEQRLDQAKLAAERANGDLSIKYANKVEVNILTNAVNTLRSQLAQAQSVNARNAGAISANTAATKANAGEIRGLKESDQKQNGRLDNLDEAVFGIDPKSKLRVKRGLVDDVKLAMQDLRGPDGHGGLVKDNERKTAQIAALKTENQDNATAIAGKADKGDVVTNRTFTIFAWVVGVFLLLIVVFIVWGTISSIRSGGRS